MAISYHVYANDGQGGAIDYSTPIATVPAGSAASSGSFVTKPLAAPSDNLFGVRAFDDASGVEEANTEARVRLVIDAGGADISSQPNPVLGLSARWGLGQAGLISWGYSPSGQGGPPAVFDVTSAPADVPAIPGLFSYPAQQVAYVPGVAGYGCRLDGLTATSGWVIQVRAVDGSGAIAGPTATVTLGKQSGALAAVDGLAATPSA